MSGIMQMLVGGKGRRQVALTLASSINNYTLDTFKVSGYEPGETDVILTIDAGVVVGSSSTGSHSLTVDASWHANDTIKIVNNGTVAGRGGGPGGPGGPAMLVQRAISVANNGVIGGGGGGGGSGGNGTGESGCNFESGIPCDPGQGGSPCPAAGGSGGSGQGSQGGATGGSGGGSCGCYCIGSGGSGGSGGVYGSGGNSGGSGSGCCGSGGGSSGGAPGACTSGNSNITWLATGTRHGALN